MLMIQTRAVQVHNTRLERAMTHPAQALARDTRSVPKDTTATTRCTVGNACQLSQTGATQLGVLMVRRGDLLRRWRAFSTLPNKALA